VQGAHPALRRWCDGGTRLPAHAASPVFSSCACRMRPTFTIPRPLSLHSAACVFIPQQPVSSFRSHCLYSAATCVFIPQPLSLFRSHCLHSAATVFIPQQPVSSFRSHCLHSAATVFIPQQPVSSFRSNLCLHSAATVFIPQQPVSSFRSHCLHSAATCVFIPQPQSISMLRPPLRASVRLAAPGSSLGGVDLSRGRGQSRSTLTNLIAGPKARVTYCRHPLATPRPSIALHSTPCDA